MTARTLKVRGQSLNHLPFMTIFYRCIFDFLLKYFDVLGLLYNIMNIITHSKLFCILRSIVIIFMFVFQVVLCHYLLDFI